MATTKKIFVAATGQQNGKTTTSISLLHMARKKYRRVGFIKPLGPKPTIYNGRWVDLDAALMAKIYGLDEDLDFMSPVVLQPRTTRNLLDGKISAASLLEKIRQATAELERRCDFLIIEGAGHSGVGSVLGLNNPFVAATLGAPMIMVSGAGIGKVVDNVHLNYALCRQEGADLRLVMANKLFPDKREKTLRYLQLAFQDMPFKVAAGFNYSPILANPTMKHIANLFNLYLKGDRDAELRIIHHMQLGAASTQRVADLLDDATLLIVTSTRNELLVTLAALYNIPEYRHKIAGLLIPGSYPISKVTQQILDRSNIPYLRAENFSSTTVFSAIENDVAKIYPEDTEKISLLQTLAETAIDFDAIDAMF
jgi:BioD-like phosphotransacetylase family protein